MSLAKWIEQNWSGYCNEEEKIKEDKDYEDTIDPGSILDKNCLIIWVSVIGWEDVHDWDCLFEAQIIFTELIIILARFYNRYLINDDREEDENHTFTENIHEYILIAADKRDECFLSSLIIEQNNNYIR